MIYPTLPPQPEEHPTNQRPTPSNVKHPKHQNQTRQSCSRYFREYLNMDSPIVAQLFRQLFHHRPPGCKSIRNLPRLRNGLRTTTAISQNRFYAAGRPSSDRGMKTNESRWQQRTNLLPQDRSAEFAEYPYITAAELKERTERPRKVKMLLRDFIDGKLLYQFTVRANANFSCRQSL